MTSSSDHDAAILDQFTRQAIPFSQRRIHSNGKTLEQLRDACALSGSERVLDVACGPGIVSCFLAASAREVVGVDMVPAMLELAAARQREQNRTNLSWQPGKATELPFADASFDVVVARYSFHHYDDPMAAFAEMKRVCRPGGRIVIMDVAPRSECREAYDEIERWRDPSHTSARTEEEFHHMGAALGLKLLQQKRFALEENLEGLLGISFPVPGGADKIRQQLIRDIDAEKDLLGIQAFRHEGQIHFYFPVLTLAWECPQGLQTNPNTIPSDTL